MVVEVRSECWRVCTYKSWQLLNCVLLSRNGVSSSCCSTLPLQACVVDISSGAARLMNRMHRDNIIMKD